ncbi:MAG: protein kinase domain-containing protein, partial [Bryobacteraceae bacterium]
VYDIAEQDGIDYMVLEFVAGRTLDHSIPRHGMRRADLVRTALPVAGALAKAHGAGIVHRDLKPANIIVAGDGHVKVLDFGLAKLTDAGAGAGSSATLTVARHTMEGTIVGTAAYMSPEQAEGRPVDARSDIFSFGAMLYEMASGRRAFSGDTPLSTLTSVLHKEPEPLDEEIIPRELARIIHRCLRKDADRRYHHIADVRIALEDLKEESGSVAAPPVHSRSLAPVLAAAALLAIAAFAGGYLLARRAAPPAAPELRLRRLSHDAGFSLFPSISPDGSLVAYCSDRARDGGVDIWLQQISGGLPVRLTSSKDACMPAFSPDGSRIAYMSSEGAAAYT